MEKGRADFIDEREDSSNISKYNSEDSEDEPMYKLRARKATKSFNFKEYDELINSALRVTFVEIIICFDDIGLSF